MSGTSDPFVEATVLRADGTKLVEKTTVCIATLPPWALRKIDSRVVNMKVKRNELNPGFGEVLEFKIDRGQFYEGDFESTLQLHVQARLG